MHRFKWLGWFGAGLLTGVALVLGTFAFAADNSRMDIGELRRLVNALSLVRVHYVDEPQDRQLVDGSLRGLMASLDGYSEYIEPAAWDELREKPARVRASTGLDIRVERKNLFVLTPLDGSPAERAGIRNGDVLVEIDGANVQKRSRGEVGRMLRGEEPGRTVTVKVSREGTAGLLSFAMNEELVRRPAVTLQMLENGIAYARVPALNELTPLELIRQFRGMQDSLRGVVLDLRKNPGGLVTTAVGVSAIFLKPDSVVAYLENRGDPGVTEHRARYQDYRTVEWTGDAMQVLSPVLKTIPLAVLVDGGSSSGSEMIAGALQDHRRATIVGARTPGNTLIQSIYPLGDTDALKISTGRWLSPNRRSLAGIGVTPDIVVQDPNANVGDVSGRDTQFAAALRVVQRK